MFIVTKSQTIYNYELLRIWVQIIAYDTECHRTELKIKEKRYKYLNCKNIKSNINIKGIL